ncbi:hypothetical protein AD998_11655 [bacterium 336/3]|nr:hypothetical protein AD998_11655 [bacterium 336/3]
MITFAIKFRIKYKITRTLMKPLYLSIFLLLFIHFQSFGQLLFSSGPNSPFGTSPLSGQRLYMQAADFNGDGISDIAMSSISDNIAVRIVNEDGDPTQVATALYSCGVGAGAAGIATGDFDGDGDIDIAVANSSTMSISRFKNDGNGVFANMGNITTIHGAGFKELISLDIEGDGDLDLITVYDDGGSAALSIFKNDGLFALTEFTQGIFSAYSPEHGIAVGIFDNTIGKPALIYVDASDTVKMLVDLDTTPTPSDIYQETILASPSFRRIAVGDFNLDGNTDIAICSGTPTLGNFVRIIDGQGNGSFTIGGNFTFVFNNNTYDILAMDLDNDSDLDLTIAKRGAITQSLVFYTNDGVGNFSSATQVDVNNPGAIALGDFNIDGRPDVVVSSSTGDANYIFLNTSLGGISNPIQETYVKTSSNGDFLRYTNGAFITKTTNFSVEGWFRIDDAAFADSQYIFYNGTVGSDGFGLFLKASAGELVIDATGSPVPTGLFASNKVWHHFAVVNDKSGAWHFYLDGVKNAGYLGSDPVTLPKNRTIFCKDDDNLSDASSMRIGSIYEFRFWDVALDTKIIRQWMHVQLKKNHPKAYALNSYIPMDRRDGGNFNAYDIGYQINPTALYKEIEIIPVGFIIFATSEVAPVGDNGSGQIENASADINSRIKTGIEIDFNNAQPLPNGELLISRVFDEQPVNFYPINPSLVYSKVFWVFRSYNPTLTTFSALDELIIDIKDDQFISGLYPVLNTPSNPNPAANAFKLFMRPTTSSSPTDWVQVGIGTGFGSVRARRPASTVSEFGRELVVGVDPTTLPVRLISFEGKKMNQEINLLEWKTSFEFDNEVFEVEKSYDAKNFFKIGALEGQEKTTNNTHYKFEDKYALESAYYRLKQKDKSGKLSYSKVIHIASWDSNSSLLKVYPNPVSTEMYLDVKVVEDEEFELNIQNVYGEKTLTLKGIKSSIEQDLNKQIQNLPKGLYILKLSNPYKNYSTKFIKN